MSGKSHIFRGQLTVAQKAIPRWRVFLLILALVLALGVGSAGHTAPAHAAQFSGNSRVSHGISVSELPRPVCVRKKDYKITVTLTKHVAFLRGGEWVPGRVPTPMTAVNVEVFSTDTNVGTVDPPERLTGWLPSDKPGVAVFNFHAKEAGFTKLYFEALVEGEYIDANVSINVENCSYKVKMNATDIDSRGGVTIWTTGNLEVKITGDGGEMTGSAAFAFDSGFVGPPCSITYTEFQNPTTITGQVDDNDQLVLQFEYEPGTITSNVSCPDAGGGSASHQIDLTNTGITSATFLASGGTRMFHFTYAGSDMAPGTMIINVEPVPEDEGGLSS